MSDTTPWPLPAPDLAPWRAGNTGCEGVWRFESAAAGRDVLVTTLVHGNELCGGWAVAAALAANLRPRRGALTLALVNLGAFDRYDTAKPFESRKVDQDLNRLWGLMAWRAGPAEAFDHEQRRVLAVLPFIERADWLLDLHSMSAEAPALMLTGMAPRNTELALAIGAPALVVADAGHAEGSRMRDHGAFGVVDDDGRDKRALLLECGFHGALSSRTVALDVTARFLVASGAVDEGDLPSDWRQQLPVQQQRVVVTQAVAALPGEPPRFAADWQTGQRIAGAGTLLGWNGGAPFHTPYDDCTLIMPSLRQVRPGLTIVRLARDAD